MTTVQDQTVSPTTYFTLAQRQLAVNLQLASTWAAAMTAMSGSMFSRPAPTAQDAGAVRNFRLIDGAANPMAGWPRWLNESPSMQPDLFDEAIELLVDEDIKTAS